MKKFLLGLLVLAVIIYVGGTAITANQTNQFITDFYAEQQSELQGIPLELELDWHQQGWWTSAFTVTLTGRVEDMEHQFKSDMSLSHGLARSRVTGEHWFELLGENLNEAVFGGEPIRSSGHVGVGGLALTIETQAINETFADGDLQLEMSPMVWQLAVADDEQRFAMDLPYLQLREKLLEEQLRIDDQGQPYTDLVAGSFELDLREFTLDSGSRSRNGTLVFQELNGALSQLEMLMGDETTLLVDTQWRSRGEVEQGQYTQHLEVDIGQLRSIFGQGAAQLDLSLTGLPYAQLERWQQLTQSSTEPDEEVVRQLLAESLTEWYENEPELQVHRLYLTEEELGELELHGRAWFNESFAAAEPGTLFRDSASFLQHVDLAFDITEAPMMLRMTMMPVTSAELPWEVRLEGEHLYLNGERLSEEELVEDLP